MKRVDYNCKNHELLRLIEHEINYMVESIKLETDFMRIISRQYLFLSDDDSEVILDTIKSSANNFRKQLIHLETIIENLDKDIKASKSSLCTRC